MFCIFPIAHKEFCGGVEVVGVGVGGEGKELEGGQIHSLAQGQVVVVEVEVLYLADCVFFG